LGGGLGGGRGASSSTLMDAFSDPITVSALNMSREGIVDPASALSYAHLAPRSLALGDVRALRRWDPWVRSTLLQGELLTHWSFAATADAAGHPVGLSLCWRDEAVLTLLRPDDELLRSQVRQVISYAALRQDRAAEILAQIDGQFPFWQALFPLRLQQLPRTQEIIVAVTQLAVFIEMRFKHDFACKRPIEFSPQVQPMISTPGHGTYPMGHATQVYAVLAVLQQLYTQALSGGAALGTLLGRCAVALFDGSDLPQVAAPFLPDPAEAAGASDLERTLDAQRQAVDRVTVKPEHRSTVLAEMWRLACREIEDLAGPLTAAQAAPAAKAEPAA
jgi:hypothetical protein